MEEKAFENNLKEIDTQILKLINKRVEIVSNISKEEVLLDLSNEQIAYEYLESINQGALTKESIKAIFSEVFSISRDANKKETIAFLGPAGSYTHQAAESIFGSLDSFVSISSIAGIFREIANRNIKFGVIPIENSSNGMVSDTIASFDKYDVNIVAEVVIDIHHTLSSNSSNIKDIKRIYSKDIAFDQCKIFLENMGLESVEHVFVDSTTKAAMIAQKEEGAAAICPAMGAKMYQLPMLFKNIEDNPENRTRFFVISDYKNEPCGDDKTTIIAQLPNTPGTLVEFLTDFNNAGINLTKIKSHIVNGVSIFFIDFNGHLADKQIDAVLTKHKSSVKVLGSYKKTVEDI